VYLGQIVFVRAAGFSRKLGEDEYVGTWKVDLRGRRKKLVPDLSVNMTKRGLIHAVPPKDDQLPGTLTFKLRASTMALESLHNILYLSPFANVPLKRALYKYSNVCVIRIDDSNRPRPLNSSYI
jgi:hypothetical protein